MYHNSDIYTCVLINGDLIMQIMKVFLGLIFFGVNVAVGLEEPEPEILLQPRNFNPHPYEVENVQGEPYYSNQIDAYSQNTGPVVFPPNAPEPAGNAVQDDHPIHKHPYSAVAKKKKFRLGVGRFHKEEPVNAQVYSALAAHGAKVLQVPSGTDLKDVELDPSFSNQKKNYAFSYKVVDHLTGDDFSHSQTQNSHATNGEYRVKLPDGRLQIVSYTADSNGYKAEVRYAENEEKAAEEYPPGYAATTDSLPGPHYKPSSVTSNYINDRAAVKPFYTNSRVQLVEQAKLPVHAENGRFFARADEQKLESELAGPTLASYTVQHDREAFREGVSPVPTFSPELHSFDSAYIRIDPTYPHQIDISKYQ